MGRFSDDGEDMGDFKGPREGKAEDVILPPQGLKLVWDGRKIVIALQEPIYGGATIAVINGLGGTT